MRIAFVHPDLGIGGAERLVIDAAVGLQKLGHEIVIYTSYRDTQHCFDEARDGTLQVRVRGDTLFPANIGGRFAILCAMLRQLHLAIALIIDNKDAQYDAIFIDQLSTVVPLLKLFLPSIRILFYCHFPDKLLSRRTNMLKSLYRVPFDAIEEWTTGQADTIVVNSKFTASIFTQAFTRISRTPKVVYPCIDVHQAFSKAGLLCDRKIVLSINRFERKKGLNLAICAFAKLKAQKDFDQAILIIAGGYDDRVRENVECLEELRNQCGTIGLGYQTMKAPYPDPLEIISPKIPVLFLLSIPGKLKSALLASSEILLYTPQYEHFGIVPLEASLAGLPVLAQDNGGPLETVEDGVTGFLRPADDESWAEVLRHVLFEMDKAALKEIGRHGRERVIQSFSQESMSQTLQEEFETLLLLQRDSSPPNNMYAMALLALLLYSLWRWVLAALIQIK